MYKDYKIVRLDWEEQDEMSRKLEETIEHYTNKFPIAHDYEVFSVTPDKYQLVILLVQERGED